MPARKLTTRNIAVFGSGGIVREIDPRLSGERGQLQRKLLSDRLAEVNFTVDNMFSGPRDRRGGGGFRSDRHGRPLYPRGATAANQFIAPPAPIRPRSGPDPAVYAFARKPY